MKSIHVQGLAEAVSQHYVMADLTSSTTLSTTPWMQNLELNHGKDSMGKRVSMKTLIWQGNDFIECRYFGIMYNTHMPGAKSNTSKVRVYKS